MEASFIIESSPEDSAACLPLPRLCGEPRTPLLLTLSQSVSLSLSPPSLLPSYTNTTQQTQPLILSQGLHDSNPSWSHLLNLNFFFFFCYFVVVVVVFSQTWLLSVQGVRKVEIVQAARYNNGCALQLMMPTNSESASTVKSRRLKVIR